MAKYGIENFKFTILEWWPEQDESDEAERFWISFLRRRNPAYGYNSAYYGGLGVEHGPDHPNFGKPAHNRILTDQSTIHKMLQRHGGKDHSDWII